MKFVLVAQDFSPSTGLNLLCIGLEYRNHTVSTYLSYGIKTQVEISENEIAGADVVLVGMSSSPELAQAEIKAIKLALEYNKPYGLFSDTFGVFTRPWFEFTRNSANFLFVLNKEEADIAKPLFPNSTIIASGHPIHENFFDVVELPAGNEFMSLAQDYFIILVPGGKDLTVNSLHIEAVTTAIKLINNEISSKPVFVIYSKHPGDTNSSDIYEKIGHTLDVPIRVVTKDECPTEKLLTVANIVIASASTVGLEAACKRIPVVDFFSEPALVRLEKSCGSRKWKPCELGIELVSYTINDLSEILKQNDYADLKKRQTEVLPEPRREGQSVCIIADALEKH